MALPIILSDLARVLVGAVPAAPMQHIGSWVIGGFIYTLGFEAGFPTQLQMQVYNGFTFTGLDTSNPNKPALGITSFGAHCCITPSHNYVYVLWIRSSSNILPYTDPPTGKVISSGSPVMEYKYSVSRFSFSTLTWDSRVDYVNIVSYDPFPFITAPFSPGLIYQGDSRQYMRLVSSSEAFITATDDTHIYGIFNQAPYVIWRPASGGGPATTTPESYVVDAGWSDFSADATPTGFRSGGGGYNSHTASTMSWAPCFLDGLVSIPSATGSGDVYALTSVPAWPTYTILTSPPNNDPSNPTVTNYRTIPSYPVPLLNQRVATIISGPHAGSSFALTESVFQYNNGVGYSPWKNSSSSPVTPPFTPGYSYGGTASAGIDNFGNEVVVIPEKDLSNTPWASLIVNRSLTREQIHPSSTVFISPGLLVTPGGLADPFNWDCNMQSAIDYDGTVEVWWIVADANYPSSGLYPIYNGVRVGTNSWVSEEYFTFTSSESWRIFLSITKTPTTWYVITEPDSGGSPSGCYLYRGAVPVIAAGWLAYEA